MKNLVMAIATLATTTLVSCQNNKYLNDCKITTEEDSISYSLGLVEASGFASLFERMPFDTIDVKQFASAFAISNLKDDYIQWGKEQFESFNPELFKYGFAHQLYKNTGKINIQVANLILNRKYSEVNAKKDSIRHQEALANLEIGKAFLEENAKKEGVVTLESGLQYKVITAGTGKKPSADERVKVHYTGSLIDGTVFDSSIERGEPIVFNTKNVIKGWSEILQHMPVGSKWTVYIPSELAYGEQGAGDKIPGNSTLIFEIELLEIVK